ncbi:MAG: amino acid ABC transporter substrate-binding protein [Bacteroidales bacterium]
MRKSNRKLLSAIFCLFFAANLFAQTSNRSYETTRINGQEFYIYQVSQAEGFYSLTKQFNVTQAEIEKYNPETRAGLKKGQHLLIPVHSTATTPKHEKADDYFTHTIMIGETLQSLANMYQISPNDIIAINPGLPNQLIPGHAIRIPQATSLYRQNGLYVFHTIEPKETLFSLSKKYGVTMQSIMEENPGLTTSSFAIGRIIRIKPADEASLSEEKVNAVPMMRYQVKKKETFYSLSRKFDVSLSELLEYNPGITRVKEGDFLNIPAPAPQESLAKKEVPTVDSLQEMHLILENASKIEHQAQVKVALMLPFELNKLNTPQARQNRYVEFYEGFLIAVDSIRHSGVSIDLYVFDTETEGISSILKNPTVAGCDLIIGPAHNDQINQVAKFANEHGINMINPFTFDSDATENNPHLFQLNTPNSYLYAESAAEFVNLFKERQIVFLQETGFHADKKEFIDYLRNELTLRGLEHKDYEYTTNEQLSAVDSILNLSGEVVFVPISSKKEVLNKLLPSLQVMKKSNDSIQISLFGYPEWQMYTNDFMNSFYDLDTYIYTRIYLNPFSSFTKNFYEKFKYWYKRDLLPIYPRYGVLGFDTGMFFLEAVNKYGKSFDAHIDMIPAASLQTAMCFRRINNWSGFINRCIYFVNFRPNGTIKKIEVK